MKEYDAETGKVLQSVDFEPIQDNGLPVATVCMDGKLVVALRQVHGQMLIGPHEHLSRR